MAGTSDEAWTTTGEPPFTPSSRQRVCSGHNYRHVEVSGNAQAQLGDKHFHFYPNDQTSVNRLCASLYFPEMFYRYESIKEKQGKTFQWILDLNTGNSANFSDRKWDPFVDWLTSNEKLYWISGKPGSGKSTMVKYLFETLQAREQGKEHLRVTLSFWFWDPGQQLQKTANGCLRSLLWQLFNDLTCQPILLPYFQNISVHTWTAKRLLESLSICLSTLEEHSISALIFLDGLDESGEDREQVLYIISQLMERLHCIKLCVSSRNEQIFTDKLSSFSKLRLQDLSIGDIKELVDERFCNDSKVQQLSQSEPQIVSKLKQELVTKADGVFLWVCLAIRSILQGITKRDTVETLKRRLRDLPDDLENLYTLMLDRDNNDSKYYHNTAALYYQLALHRQFSLLQFCIATNHSLRNRVFGNSATWNLSEIFRSTNSTQVEVWIVARTSGLLEVHDPEPNFAYRSELGQLDKCRRKFVQFIHKSVRDYLLHTRHGQSIISSSELNDHNISSLCFKSALVDRNILEALRMKKINLNQIRDIPGVFNINNSERTYNCICSPASDNSQLQIAKQTWNELHVQGFLDTEFWVPGMRLTEFQSPLSTYEDGKLDLCRIYCYLGWFIPARTELERLGLHKDVLYVSQLLLYVTSGLYCSTIDQLKRLIRLGPKPWMYRQYTDFIKELVSIGASLCAQLTLPWGERVTVLSLLISVEIQYLRSELDDSFPHVIGPRRMTLRLAKSSLSKSWVNKFFHLYAFKSLTEKSESSHDIQSCTVGLIKAFFNRRRARWQIWGIWKVAFPRSEDKVTNLMQIRILVRIGDVKWPDFYAISKDDSDFILRNLESAPLGNETEIFGDDTIVNDVCLPIIKRSKQFSSPNQALQYLGKDPEHIQRFADTQLIDLLQNKWHLGDKIGAWKEWFLGTEAESVAVSTTAA